MKVSGVVNWLRIRTVYGLFGLNHFFALAAFRISFTRAHTLMNPDSGIKHIKVPSMCETVWTIPKWVSSLFLGLPWFVILTGLYKHQARIWRYCFFFTYGTFIFGGHPPHDYRLWCELNRWLLGVVLLAGVMSTQRWWKMKRDSWTGDITNMHQPNIVRCLNNLVGQKTHFWWNNRSGKPPFQPASSSITTVFQISPSVK